MNLALASAAAALLAPCAPCVGVGGLPAHLTEREVRLMRVALCWGSRWGCACGLSSRAAVWPLSLDPSSHHSIPVTTNHRRTQLRALLGAFGTLKALSFNPARRAAVAEFVTPDQTEAAAAGLSSMSLAGQPLQITRQGPVQNDYALRSLIQQQQAALVARLSGRPPPPPVSLLKVLADAGFVAPSAAAAGAAVAGGEAQPQPPLPAEDDPPVAAQTAAVTTAVAPAPAAAAAAAGNTVPSTRRIVRLEKMVSLDDLADDEEYSDLVQEVTEEVGKYGRLERVIIPRPSAGGGGGGGGGDGVDDKRDGAGVGLVFLVYTDPSGAENARVALHGREFGGGRIVASLHERDVLDGFV